MAAIHAVGFIAHRCDVCRRAEGVRFADQYWACLNCAARIFRRLEEERSHL
jgi:hypothetical protein